MKLVDVNQANISLSPPVSDETLLQRNLQALRDDKNAEGRRISNPSVPLTAALVKMKWKNRRDIYAYQVKEEIFGAALCEVMERYPHLRDKILAHTEASYQHVLHRETATLEISRGLADGDYRTSNVILKLEKDDEKRPDQPVMSVAK
ncbi:cytoplasmic protein [Kluyvera sichuanensis]|uniref:cytoplasmic protein n=1 Tax=Kluyvera sichuanensis TaxID=2725494 RepID=UPI0039F4498E